MRRFYPLKFGAAGRPSLFFCRIKNAYCRPSTINAYIMLNLCSESLRLTAPRAAVTALYFFCLREFYTANPVFCQKYRLILAYISTIECRLRWRWANRCPQFCGQLLQQRNTAEHIYTAAPNPAAINGRKSASVELGDGDIAKCDTLAAVDYREGDAARSSTRLLCIGVYWSASTQRITMQKVKGK